MLGERLFENLTDAQREAVTALDGPVVVSAGAGSGKTSVLVRRYIHLLSRGIEPHQILAVTFTNKAAEQLRERVVGLLGEKIPQPVETIRAVERSPHLGTLHGLCLRIVNQFGSLRGYEPVDEIQNQMDWAVAFDSAYDAWSQALSESILSEFLSFADGRRMRDWVYELYPKRRLFRESLDKDLWPMLPIERKAAAWLFTHAIPFCETLAKSLQHLGTYSFDDLEMVAIELLEQEESCRDFFRQELKHLLVDEFQDTSIGQWRIIQALARPDLGNLFVVGDAKQSIYRFRHAEVSLFIDLMRRSQEGRGQAISLDINFRSQVPVLNAINQLSESIFTDTAVPFSALTAGCLTRTADRHAGVGRIGFAEMPEGGEAEAVAEHIATLLGRGFAASEIAVLFRSADRMGIFANALARRGILSELPRAGELFTNYDVVDLINFLRLICDRSRDGAAAAFYLSPYINGTRERLYVAQTNRGEATLFSALPQLSWMEGLQENTSFTLALNTLFRTCGHFPESGAALLKLLEGLCRQPNVSCKEALRRLEVCRDETIILDAVGGAMATESVRLMTVHAAKGLEFPQVILVDLLRQSPRTHRHLRVRPNQPPGIRARYAEDEEEKSQHHQLGQEEADADWDEAKRVLYVALTRAEEGLWVSLPMDAKSIPKKSWAALVQGYFESMPFTSGREQTPSVSIQSSTATSTDVPLQP